MTGQGGASPAPVEASLASATAGYKQYAIGEVAALVPATKQFTDAVRAGDVAAAQKAYAPARYHYEQIEPVAESFGDLDPAIDQRIADVEPGTEWTGFHRIEQALWVNRTPPGSRRSPTSSTPTSPSCSPSWAPPNTSPPSWPTARANC